MKNKFTKNERFKMVFKTALKHAIFTAMLFILIPSSSTFARQNMQEIRAEELELKQWSLHAVTKIMTFNHNNFLRNIEQNKQFLSLGGCRKFLWSMDMFGIRELVNEGEKSVKAERIKTLDQNMFEIEVERVSDDRAQKQGADEDQKMWEVKIPIILEFQTGLMKREYKVISTLRVLRLSSKKYDFVIQSWKPHYTRQSMGFDSIKYKKSDYKECDAIPFAIISQDDD